MGMHVCGITDLCSLHTHVPLPYTHTHTYISISQVHVPQRGGGKKKRWGGHSQTQPECKKSRTPSQKNYYSYICVCILLSPRTFCFIVTLGKTYKKYMFDVSPFCSMAELMELITPMSKSLLLYYQAVCMCTLCPFFHAPFGICCCSLDLYPFILFRGFWLCSRYNVLCLAWKRDKHLQHCES